MRYATEAMKALLAGGGPFFLANLYTFTLPSGTVHRWTSADTNLTVGASTWICPASDGSTCPILKRGPIRNARGLEVQTLALTMLCGDSVQLQPGVNIQRFALNGGFDGAEVRVDLAVMPTWGDTSAGAICLFEGQVAGVDPSSTRVELKVKSELEKLEIPMPRILFQTLCNNWIGDAGCGVNRAGITGIGTVSGSPTTRVLAGAPAHANGYYDNGVLVMTSGLCAGSRRAVQAYAAGLTTLATPLPQAPAVGDTFTIFPGCDRTKGSGGCAKFANLARFRGCPHIPVPETVR